MALVLSAGAAAAHTGHGTSGFLTGLEHPFGVDHLLAMVAVGVWSVSALPGQKVWWGPVTFMTALVASAVVGGAGVSIPYLENLVSLSVVFLGAMLVLSAVQMRASVGLSLIAGVATIHGLSHGSEASGSGFFLYAIGFLTTTAGLHFFGVMISLFARSYFAKKATPLVQSLGVLFGGVGIYLFSQL